jgi:translation initiation factor IF-3
MLRMLSLVSISNKIIKNNNNILHIRCLSKLLNIAKNNDISIKYKTLRVVYKDKNNGEEKHEIMTRNDALTFANDMDLDLILVNDKADPPVCRLDDYGLKLKDSKQKLKIKRAKERERSVKEMFISAGIGPHDLQTKVNKIKDFLNEGHPVKVFLVVDNSELKKNPLAIEEITLKFLESIENHVGTMTQPTSNSVNKREFTLNPKPKKDPIPKDTQ